MFLDREGYLNFLRYGGFVQHVIDRRKEIVEEATREGGYVPTHVEMLTQDPEMQRLLRDSGIFDSLQRLDEALKRT